MFSMLKVAVVKGGNTRGWHYIHTRWSSFLANSLELTSVSPLIKEKIYRKSHVPIHKESPIASYLQLDSLNKEWNDQRRIETFVFCRNHNYVWHEYV